VNTFPLIISSPDGDLFRGDAEMLILRGTEGDLAVMAGHVPFVTAVQKGHCVLVSADGKRREGEMEAGMLTVARDQVTVLTAAITWNS
jgi:F-type H+-transporting ATPase subunit epsilon